MTQYTSPGVKIRERSASAGSIGGFSPSGAAIIGWTPSGAINTPTLVTNISQYEGLFGKENSKMYLAALGFFSNGGKRLYVVRTVPSDADYSFGDISSSEVVDEDTGAVGDATAKTFSFTLDSPPARRSVVVGGVTPAVDLTDDGNGALTGGGTGTVNYETGAVSVTFTAAPGVGPIVASYGKAAFSATSVWPGVKANDFEVRISGDAEYVNEGIAGFDRFTLQVVDVSGDADVVVESWSGLSVDDVADPNFVTLVINDPDSGSKLIELATIDADGISDLSGSEVTGESATISVAFDGTRKTGVITLAEGSLAKTTLSLVFSGGQATIVDDGDGGLVKTAGTLVLDTTGTNTVDYDTGVINVAFTVAPTAASSATAEYFTQPVADVVSVRLGGGDDGTALARADVSAPTLEASRSGMFALQKSDEMLIVTIPDFASDETVTKDLSDYCDTRTDRFGIAFTPEGSTAQGSVNWKLRRLNSRSKNIALYSPWIKIVDPFTSKSRFLDAVGHIAGIYARTDDAKGVWKSPAGVEDGAIRGAIGVKTEFTDEEVGVLTQGRVNAIVNWNHTGLCAWGARTLESGGDFGYIGVKRLFMYVEKAVFQATQTRVFEDNGPALWQSVRFQVSSLLSSLYASGALKGNSKEEAFYVVCDETNNTQATIDAGEMYCKVGMAANKPAEFVVFDFTAKL